MNKNIKLAVAGAVLALSASAANAGIVIPAGEWTLDVSGNVNSYTSWAHTNASGASVDGGLANAYGPTTGVKGGSTTNRTGNGLLPNFLGFTGTTRQNDLDVSWTISIQPGSSHHTALGQGTDGGINNRQAFITFGDKSWGSVKLGKDLAIFASDAILNDITLLGVGGSYAGGAENTSLGRIGFGYLYADWKPQISYTTPNMSGFQATVGISQAFQSNGNGVSNGNNAGDTLTSSATNASPAYEGKASYSFAVNDVSGKVWVSGIAQHVSNFTALGNEDPTSYAGDIGAQVKVAGFDLSGYYYSASGVGTTGQGVHAYGYNATSKQMAARDSDGGYVQLKYTLPIKTTAALSWGQSNLDTASGESYTNLVKSNEMWDAMLIHPLTKHLNLVAEYSNQRSENQTGGKITTNVGSVGGILFF